MSVAEIQQGSKVSMHFAIKLPDGQVVDSTFEKAPAEFAMGDGNLLPGFEEYLVGLVSGDHKEFAIPPEKGFGQPNPQNMQEMKLSDFPVDMPVAPGLMVSFADALSPILLIISLEAPINLMSCSEHILENFEFSERNP